MSDNEDGRPPANKWKVLISVVFGIFMAILDTTIVNVAFPTLRREFGADISSAQWIVSLYVLALGVSTPLAGYLGDRFGIKRIYLLGLGLFAGGSLLSGLAPSLFFLIAARALQGIGAGIALPLGTAQLYLAFPPEERGTAFGLFGVALLVAPALGPILGGILVDQGLWRWVFFVNIPVGIVGIWIGSRWLQEQRKEKRPRLDVWGLVTSVIGFGGLLYAASLAANTGWGGTNVLIGFAVGGAGLIAFVLIELFVAPDPLLDFGLFGHRVFLVATLVGWVTVLSLFGAEFMLPIYLQSLRGQSALQTGWLLLPLAVTAGIATPLAGRLYDKIGPRALVAFGFGVLVINAWQLSELNATTTMGWIVFLMVLRGLALGTTVQTTFTTALGSVHQQRVARGSSLINSTRFVVQSVGVAILATVLSSPVARPVAAYAGQVQETGTPANPTPLCQAGADRNATVATFAAADSITKERIACGQRLTGFENAYRLTLYMAILALVIGVFLPGWPFGWSGRTGLEPREAG